MKLWIARASENTICLFRKKTAKYYDKLTRHYYWNTEGGFDYLCLSDSDFPEITFENSPQEVELKLLY